MSSITEQTAPASKLSFGKKLGYGVGGAASNFIWMMISFYMLFFYTDVFGIPAAVAGTLFMVARVWDAVNDPIMGYLADQTRTRWGKFRPYLLFGAVPLGIAYVLTFTTPGLSATGKVVYAAVTYILLGMLYTVVNIPYNSLAAVITQNTNERSSLASFMLITSYLAVLILVVATIPLVNLFPTEQTGFSFVVGIYAVISVVLFIICFASTRENPALVKREGHSFVSRIKTVLQNKYLLILISAIFFTTVANEMRTTAAIYFFKYNVGDEGRYPLFMLAVILLMIVGAGLAPVLSRKLGSKRNLYYIATLLTLPSIGILFVAFDNLPVIFALTAISSAGGGMIFVLNWSMLPDTVEYGEWKSGIRSEGMVYASMTFTNKMSYAVGGALAAFLLSWSGFVPNIAQAPQTQTVIVYMLALFPVIAGVLAAIILSLYKIDAKFHSKLLGDLSKQGREMPGHETMDPPA